MLASIAVLPALPHIGKNSSASLICSRTGYGQNKSPRGFSPTRLSHRLHGCFPSHVALILLRTLEAPGIRLDALLGTEEKNGRGHQDLRPLREEILSYIS